MADITFDFEVKPIIFDLTFNTSSGGGGIGTVTSVAVGSPLSSALTFNTPTTTPSLVIQNASAPGTQFLRGDGTWAVPPGSGGSGTVTSAGVGSPLSNALTFNTPSTTPSLVIQNASAPSTQFLRGDGAWAVPPGSGGTGTVTSITASTGLSGGVITTSGTIALLPAVGSTTIGGVKAGANIAIAADGTISSTGSGTGGISALTAGIGLGAPTTGVIITTTGTLNLLAPTASIIGGVKAGTNITIDLDGTISATQITPPSPATVVPLPDGTGAIGTSLLYARQDHVHPFALTTTGTTGAATYSAATGALNIPSYSGGGGGGGFSWSSVANIAVNDVFIASSAVEVQPGATQVFDGATVFNTSFWNEARTPLRQTIPSNTLNGGFASAGNNVIAGTAGARPLYSSDAGFTWNLSNTTVALPSNSVAMKGLGNGFVSLGATPQRSIDGGLNWSPLSANPANQNVLFTNSTAFVSFNVTGGTATAYRSTDGGGSWNTAGTFSGVNSINTGANNATTILVQPTPSSGTSRQTFYSDDGGATWIGSGTLTFGFTQIIAVGTTAFVGYGGGSVYFTTDKGVSWTQGAAFISGFTVIPFTSIANALVGVEGPYGDIVVSTDFGATLNNVGTVPYFFGQALQSAPILFGTSNSLLASNSTSAVFRAPATRSLFIYSTQNATIQTAPNGTYRCLGAAAGIATSDSLWIRTA